jgi:Domain of unknown function (DUF4833)
MKAFVILIVVLVFGIILNAPEAYSQDSLQFPTPAGNPNQLFFLQRSQNTNTVIYELNFKNGIVDSVEPVHIFWICYAEHGQREELTELQRKRAYGLATKYITKDHYELRFLADKKYALDLMKGPDNKFHTYHLINQKQVIFSKIYLQIHGGTLFSPNIKYVVLTGIDPVTGAEVSEKKTI